MNAELQKKLKKYINKMDFNTAINYAALRLFRREEEDGTPPPPCNSGNEYDGRIGLRVSAIFVIMIGSGLGE